MAEEDRTVQPSRAQVNRRRQQGLGVGQTELNTQRDPDGAQRATDPQRTEPFDTPDAGDEDAELSAHRARRTEKTEAERAQGAKTRQLNKDIISRRT